MFGIDISNIRLDSTGVESNIANLPRRGLFKTVIVVFLKELKTCCPDLYEKLDGRLKPRIRRRKQERIRLLRTDGAPRKAYLPRGNGG
jgi:hypothetical protein